jgi:hypothetical protein
VPTAADLVTRIGVTINEGRTQCRRASGLVIRPSMTAIGQLMPVTGAYSWQPRRLAVSRPSPVRYGTVAILTLLHHWSLLKGESGWPRYAAELVE